MVTCPTGSWVKVRNPQGDPPSTKPYGNLNSVSTLLEMDLRCAIHLIVFNKISELSNWNIHWRTCLKKSYFKGNQQNATQTYSLNKKMPPWSGEIDIECRKTIPIAYNGVISYNPLTPCSLSNQWTHENLTKTVNISPFQAFSPSARQAFHECLTDSEMAKWCFELLETEKSLEVRYVYDCICRFFDFDRPKIIRFFRRQVKRIHILKLKSTGNSSCSPSILIETIQKKMLEQHESISYDPCYIPGFLCSFRMDGRHKHSKN